MLDALFSRTTRGARSGQLGLGLRVECVLRAVRAGAAGAQQDARAECARGHDRRAEHGDDGRDLRVSRRRLLRLPEVRRGGRGRAHALDAALGSALPRGAPGVRAGHLPLLRPPVLRSDAHPRRRALPLRRAPPPPASRVARPAAPRPRGLPPLCAHHSYALSLLY